MPGIVRGRVVGARGLPVMDSSTHSTDAYCDVRLGKLDTTRSPTVRKSLSPEWNFDFKFEVMTHARKGTVISLHTSYNRGWSIL
jgi:Ca2+-dependent lipid-binding protein